jgi:CRISPR-associated protein Csb1
MQATAFSSLPLLDLATLSVAARHAHYLRVRAILQPMGGPGAKVFPPTYGKADGRGSTYAREQRLVDGRAVDCVVLSSTQAESARHRAALATYHASRTPRPFPTILVHLPADVAADLGQPENVSVLSIPNGIYDATLFQCTVTSPAGSSRGKAPLAFRTLDDTPCSDFGHRLGRVTRDNVTSLLGQAPFALLTGAWDSHTGEASGAKIARALNSEIVARDVVYGATTSSRIDPLVRSTASMKGLREPSGKVLLVAPGEPGGSKLAEFGLGAIMPSVTPPEEIGGITMRDAELVTVISFSRLRQYGYPVGSAGRSPETDEAATTVIAALGLVAISAAWDAGLSLRSRCDLVPTEPGPVVEIGEPGSVTSAYRIDTATAGALLASAVKAARARGLPWESDLVLEPMPSYLEIVRRGLSGGPARAANTDSDAPAGR